jgi:hypothetical protein
VNPLLDAFNRTMSSLDDRDDARRQLIAKYGFAIPTDQALEAIGRCSPAGVVEIGAGTGYWARALQLRGVDVAAFDVHPPPSPQNPWFAGTQPWHAVQRGDHDVVGSLPERTLLIVWPTKNEIWPALAVERYHEAGGSCVVYVGEGPGRHTGDDVFHALLGELTTCAQCRYGSTASPCICGVEARWRRIQTIALPHWPGYDDDLRIYARHAPPRASGRWRRATPRWGRLRRR